MNSARLIEPDLRIKAAQLQVPMGDWVHSLAPWQVISHLTFAWEASIWSAARCYEKFMRTELRGVSYFYALEQNPGRDGYHVHALWVDCKNLRRSDIWRTWFERYGRNRIEPVNSRDDVADYCAKYVTKEGAWWNVKLLSRLFFCRDSPLVLEHRLRPLQARDDRFKQPFHAQGVIMYPPQIHVAGHLAIRQRPVEMFRAGFGNAQVADAVKILVLDRCFPPPPRLILFLGDDMLHDLLPRPRRQFGISAIEIHPRQAEADARRPFRFIHGVDLLNRLGLNPRFEAHRIAGGVFEGIPQGSAGASPARWGALVNRLMLFFMRRSNTYEFKALDICCLRAVKNCGLKELA